MQKKIPNGYSQYVIHGGRFLIPISARRPLFLPSLKLAKSQPIATPVSLQLMTPLSTFAKTDSYLTSSLFLVLLIHPDISGNASPLPPFNPFPTLKHFPFPICTLPLAQTHSRVLHLHCIPSRRFYFLVALCDSLVLVWTPLVNCPISFNSKTGLCFSRTSP